MGNSIKLWDEILMLNVGVALQEHFPKFQRWIGNGKLTFNCEKCTVIRSRHRKN